ncbi:MAG TPA: MmcQ/YjbR family DNA-binding protein [Nocardioidaceae bacterium]|nr:MmcQ/YjbR family DNA-binding protein [Nocardioidaceae bacterium]
MTPDDVRRLALGLEGAVEAPHHGFPSFRRRTIFATLPDEGTLNVLLVEERVRDAVAESPGFCAERWWGKKLTAVHVTLADADEQIVAELLADAWEAHG